MSDMVEQPRMTREPDGAYVVWDVAQVREGRDWRFLGWLLLGATVAMVLSDIRGWRFVESWAEYLVPLFSAFVAIVLINVGGKTQVVERPLLRVQHGLEGMEVEHYAPTGRHSIASHDLTHVVFGLVDYPWPGRQGVHVEAVALYLAKQDGTPIPVIDGTMEKLTSYRIANKLAQELQLPLIEMGKGFA